MFKKALLMVTLTLSIAFAQTPIKDKPITPQTPPHKFNNANYNDADKNTQSYYKGNGHKTNMKTQKKI